MADDPYATMSLRTMRQTLAKLHEGYPDQAPDDERTAYFAEAILRGLEAYRTLGADDAESLEKIGLAAGISGGQIKRWAERRTKVHASFHQNILSAQASLVQDRIDACQAALDKISSYLTADDWRSELGAFDHLKSLGLDALTEHGGRYGRHLAERLGILEQHDPSEFSLQLRRKALNLVADALEDLIGEAPETKQDAAAGNRPRAPEIIH
jgi:primosomal protein N''